MSIADCYDKDGKPISMTEMSDLKWGRGRDMEPSYDRVGFTEIGPYAVSTVWLGMDHSFGSGPPMIFETMVFTSSAWEADRSDPDHELLLELDAERYSTLAEAEEGHERMCLLIRATVQVDPPVGGSSDTPQQSLLLPRVSSDPGA